MLLSLQCYPDNNIMKTLSNFGHLFSGPVSSVACRWPVMEWIYQVTGNGSDQGSGVGWNIESRMRGSCWKFTTSESLIKLSIELAKILKFTFCYDRIDVLMKIMFWEMSVGWIHFSPEHKVWKIHTIFSSFSNLFSPETKAILWLM